MILIWLTFSDVNQPFPPSLSEYGRLRFSKKSVCYQRAMSVSFPFCLVAIAINSAAAVVHIFPTTSITTFGELYYQSTSCLISAGS